MFKSLKENLTSAFWFLAGIFILAGIWQIMSLSFSPLILPSPRETLGAMFNLFSSPDARQNFYVSAGRALAALMAVTIMGLGMGVVAGLYPWLEALMKPVKDILLAIPPVALTILVIFLFGSGSLQTVGIAGALALPLIYGSTVSAVRTVDRELLEMTEIFNVPRKVRLWDVYLPAVVFSSLPSVLLAAGLTVRLTVMAEVIVGVTVGIGHALSMSRVYLATQEIFAWMLILLAIVLMIEGGLLYIVKKYLLRWQA
ncbi:MAG: ABC transporter permease subunit [Firmicutes bacterium]|nr:ABC transporter permease subunit [Bacillota bacterium]